MNILYDHQIFSSQKYGGISRYFSELIRGINNKTEANAQLLIKFSNNLYLEQDKSITCKKFLPNIEFRGKPIALKIINQFHSKLHTAHRECDLYHPTYYNPQNVILQNDKPIVITVFDMIHEKLPQLYKNNKLSNRKSILCKKASHIIAISQNTKQDLTNLLNIDPRKVSVVHLANSLDATNDERPSNKIPQNYILYVGSRKAYKNFEFFLKSLAPILRLNANLNLVCVGKKFDNLEKELINNLSINHQVLSINVSDPELVYLYKNALLFVYPSLYEGFGLPLLESFACGCPVLSSNASSLPEVGGNACKYFDPHNQTELTSSINELLVSESLRNSLIKKGHQRSKLFSWDKCVSETLQVYNKVINAKCFL
ncbi:MAG TPA: glycosyltransferase family 1 protein [Bacteroidales bacterium]|nr:glycosyltransferase family 1 protein [Bacteroidales bacterium]